MKPTKGGCTGHFVDGVAPTMNYALDPSFEGAALGTLSYGGYTGGYTTAKANSGTSSYVINGAATAADAYKDFYVDVPAGDITASMKVYITAAGSLYSGRSTWIQCGGGTCTNTSPVTAYNMGMLNQWQTITSKMTFTTAGKVWIQLYGVTSSNVYFDSLIVTNGTTNYADGNTAGWSWTGAPNNSISTGPPL